MPLLWPESFMPEWMLVGDDETSPITTQSFIGIVVAICGNVLISLALNCQKLAHRNIELAREAQLGPEYKPPNPSTPPNGVSRPHDGLPVEAEPLLAKANSGRYDAIGRSASPYTPTRGSTLPPKLSHRTSITDNPRDLPWRMTRFPEEIPVPATTPLVPQRAEQNEAQAEEAEAEEAQASHEADYLKSKLWWLGFCLMNIGEIGNFLSYGFAPASVVAPLGAFALIANCFFAPLILHERFHKSDLIGMFFAIVGAATIVISTKPSSPRLDPSQLLHLLSQKPFIIYTIIDASLLAFFISSSEKDLGRRFVLVDVGICALFGGFTVLSTKAVSTLISLEWLNVFKEWLTYPLLLVLVGTGVGQIRYLNRALMKFDAKQVIPTQFVLFNISAIVGSAILYGDFNKVTVHQFVTFLYGCAATSAGVYLLTSWRHDDDERGRKEASDSELATRLPDIPEEQLEAGGSLRGSIRSSTPIRVVRRKKSTAGIGLSPAQYLLLAAPELLTPTHRHPERRVRSLERASIISGTQSPDRPSSLHQR